MLQSARSKMPALDYVSVISSLYRDRLALSLGTIASAAAAVFAGLSSGAVIHFVFAGLFVALAIWRYQQATIFNAEGLRAEDCQRAEFWELQATLSGSAAAILFGAWSFVSLVFVGDNFSALASISVSIAAMVGIVARNYGLDRLVTLQCILLGVPLCLGLIIDGNIYHVLLAALFAPMLISFRSLARDIRNVLLSAVRDRVEVSRLAQELDTALSTMSHGLCMLDRNLRVAVANEKMQEMLCEEIDYKCVGKDFAELIEMAKSRGTLTELSGQRLITAVANEGQSKLVLQLLDGRQCEVSINRGNEQTVLVLEDITERMQAESRISFMARFDPATNLPNRSYFTEQVSSKIRERQTSEAGAKEVGLVSLDLDDFKNINDSFGHPIGDRVLALVSRRLRQALDSNVVVSRFGGDEFAMFFDHNVSPDGLEQITANLLQVLATPFVLDDHLFKIKASAGIVVSPCDQCDLEELLKRADLALYEAKQDGKGTYSVFNNSMGSAYRSKQHMKGALREALENDDLMLAFQPVVDLSTNKVVGCEALARWHHPEHGIIPPYIFIPLAEEMGIISEITEWALHTATRECASWPNNIGVAVNVSARDFKEQKLQKMVKSALRKSGLSAERLEIEVTETVLVEELEVASKVLREISDLGVGIALDDFGTGYSSLGYLHNLPFSKLKVDRTFTQNVNTDPAAKKLMRNIAVLGKDLNMTVTVEGVETQEQLDVVAGIGLIDSVQGYLFGAPVSHGEIGNLISTLLGGKTNYPTNETDQFVEIKHGSRIN
ncbi:hypothetical protein MNBD_ALPHA11-1499 [hydrothermal vent metagenome]|uniref:Uncharacterized protein n=1 Tax=hydrothermal vent metagenome TaxID=652676 RepID=A0A3B0TRM5_9ZZZZ